MAKFIDLRCDFGLKFCMSSPIIMKFFLNTILEERIKNIVPSFFEQSEEQLLHLMKRLRLELFPTMKRTWNSMALK